MRHYYRAMLLALPFTLVGCENPGLQKKLGDQANEIKTLKSDLESLKAQAELDKLLRNWDQVAYLTPGSRGYSPVKTNLGVNHHLA